MMVKRNEIVWIGNRNWTFLLPIFFSLFLNRVKQWTGYGGPARRSQWSGRNLRLAGSLIKTRESGHHATKETTAIETKDEEGNGRIQLRNEGPRIEKGGNDGKKGIRMDDGSSRIGIPKSERL